MKKIGKIAGVLTGLSLVASLAFAESAKVNLPLRGEVYLSDPIVSGGHFTWSEATKGGTRIPTNYPVVLNIEEAARTMEELRTYFGNKPIYIDSWYRDEASNKRVGGVPNSEHLSGKAVDFRVKDISPREVYDRLDKSLGWEGGLGKYDTFTHIDLRDSRARWGGK